VLSASQEDATVVVHTEPSLKDTVAYVQRSVRHLLDAGRRVALISRKRSQIIPYQIVFAGDGVPFCAAEDLNVLLSEAFEQLKAILLLKAQADQPLPFGPDPIEGILKMCDRVKRYPLNKGDRGQLRSHLARERPKTVVAALESLHGYRGPLKGSNAGGQMSATYYAAIRPLMVAESVADTLRAISESFEGLQKDYGKALDDIFFADPPFLYLGEFAERYGSDFGRFYQDVEGAIASLASLSRDDEEELEGEWSKQLHLMTALRAKGKEFDDVFILDSNQGIWPSRLAVTEEDQEAERRLFYVAVTRARRALTFLVNERIFDEVAVPTQYLAEMGLAL
jgi:DNA helicase-2/ATP-dependent DNA helicase PcrA